MTTPKTAKKPADHKKKATETPKPIKIELRGRTWELEFAALDDFELIEDLSDLDRARDPRRFPAILRRLLGGRQYLEALELLRDKDSGRVTVEAGSEFLMDLFGALDPNF